MNLNKSLFILLSSVFIMQGNSCFSGTDPEIEGENICRRSPGYWATVDEEAAPTIEHLYCRKDLELKPLKETTIQPLEHAIARIDARYEEKLNLLRSRLKAEETVVTRLDEDRETDVKKFKAFLNARLDPLRQKLAVAEAQFEERARPLREEIEREYRRKERCLNGPYARYWGGLESLDLGLSVARRREEINKICEELGIPQLRAQLDAEEQANEATAEREKFHGRIGEDYVQAVRPHNGLINSIREEIEQCETEHATERAPFVATLESSNDRYNQIFGRYYEQMKQARIEARRKAVRKLLAPAPVVLPGPAVAVPAV